jgi:hypothetical protein
MEGRDLNLFPVAACYGWVVEKYFVWQSTWHYPRERLMNVSRQDASEALDAIAIADRRARQVRGYREASPFLIVWGLGWMVANAVSDLMPSRAGQAWLAVIIAGCCITLLLVIMQSRREAAKNSLTRAERMLYRRRAILIGITIMGFFPAMLTVLSPLSPRQQDAFISLFWAFAYMAGGAWLGSRLFVTGLVTAAAILGGYLFLSEHFFLWMALVGGGSLVLGGLWLRKI